MFGFVSDHGISPSTYKETPVTPDCYASYCMSVASPMCAECVQAPGSSGVVYLLWSQYCVIMQRVTCVCLELSEKNIETKIIL